MNIKLMIKTIGTLIIMISPLIFSSCSWKVNENLITNPIERQDKKGNEEWIVKTINKEVMITDADCGVVSVKMLLDFYGMDVSYEEIKKKTNSTVNGTDWEDIKKYLKTIDNVEFYEFEGNIDKAKEYLGKGYPLFICWDVDEEQKYSHYSILIAIDKNSVWMLDPKENKSLSEYSLDYFLPCWKEEDYWFCILNKKDNKTLIEMTDEKTSEDSKD